MGYNLEGFFNIQEGKIEMEAGIVGLPNVGKSTLFNVLTKSKAEAANYPFCTIDPNVGIVDVPDDRLYELAKIVSPQKIVPATVKFVDIAGLVRGASKGEGLGNKFLSHIREVDAIIHIVRCFEDENIVHVEGTINPLRDIEVINLELILADLESVEKRLERVRKNSKSGNKTVLQELELLEKLLEALNEQIPIRILNLNQEEIQILKQLNLLTSKPVLYVANLSEEDILNQDENPYLKQLKEFAAKENSKVISICAKLEEDLINLSEEERKSFLEELGLKEPGLNKLIRDSYALLNLITFFTAGPKEVHAWTIKKGTKAPQAAGKIHSDFERGFIRAEVISYEDLIKSGSFTKAKEEGLIRLEGKDYEIQDGDIVVFRFNV